LLLQVFELDLQQNLTALQDDPSHTYAKRLQLGFGTAFLPPGL
jgi:hypothetical protein